MEPLSAGQLLTIFAGGLRFDTTAILYTNILYLFFSFLPVPFIKGAGAQKALKLFYVTVNFLALALNLADTVYFRYTLRRTSMTFFSEFTGDVRFGKIAAWGVVSYWYVYLIGLLFLAALIRLSGRYGKKEKVYEKNLGNSLRYFNVKEFGSHFYIRQGIALLILIPVFIIGVRGGIGRTVRPITLSNAGDYAERPNQVPAVLNTPFSLIRTLGKAGFRYRNYYAGYEDMEGIYTPVHRPQERDDSPHDGSGAVPYPGPGGPMFAAGKTVGKGAGKNVVVFILESFSAEHNFLLNRGLEKSFTPFLDSLAAAGLFCTRAFANGYKSIDAIPAVLLSVPSLIEPFAVTPYATNKTQGLPAILKSLGYGVSFFHGAPDGSMGFRAMTRMMGIGDYYGKEEFDDDRYFDGAWGIWDEEFLQYFAKTAGTFREPFFSAVFTLSSHHPFAVPGKYKNSLPEGNVPVQKCIAYSDLALRRFFQTAESEPWFKNTIFVFTADHATHSGLYPRFNTSLGGTAIPILYYAPDFIPPRVYDTVTQQIDIMPTVLGLLDYRKPYFAYGRNILDTGGSSGKTRPFLINYNNGFQLIQGDTLLLRNEERLTGIYKFPTDTLLERNLLEEAQKINPALLQKQDLFFKAVLQQYLNRLIDNKLMP